MRPVTTATVLAAVLAAVGVFASRAAAQAPGGVDEAAVDRFLANAMRDNGIPGLAVAITHGDEAVYVKGHGRAGGDRPVTPRTQFPVASLSKSFTALAVMELAEDGRVDLDAPAHDYLPDFTLADPDAAARITVRQLLNQTSGLADAGFPEATMPQPATARQRVAALRQAEPVSPPGAEFHYFDANYGVLARLVEVVSGQPFGDYLQQRIFAPLEMTATTSVVTAAELRTAAPDLAQGHVVAFGAPVARAEPDGILVGSGGVVSTAADMANYLIMQTQDGQFEDTALVSAAGLETMHTPPEGVDGAYAMGWTVPEGSQPPRLEHTGVLQSHAAQQVLLPESGHGIVVLANSYSALANLSGIADGLVALVSGGEPDDGYLSARTLGVVFAALTAVSLGFRVGGLFWLPAWAARRRGTRWWRLLPGMVWLLLPAALLAGLPWLTTRFAGRAFTHLQLFLALPDVAVWLGSAAASGAVLLAARLVVLIWTRRRAARPAAPATT